MPRIPQEFPVLIDAYSDPWLVLEERATTFGFPICLGWPQEGDGNYTVSKGTGGHQVIITPEFRDFTLANLDRFTSLDLPLSKQMLYVLRRRISSARFKHLKDWDTADTPENVTYIDPDLVDGSELTDVQGRKFRVEQIRRAPNGIALYSGTEVGKRAGGGIIVTQELAKFVEAHRFDVQILQRELGIGEHGIRNIRIQLGHNFYQDKNEWWAERIDDLLALPTEDFQTRHGGGEIATIAPVAYHLRYVVASLKGEHRGPDFIDMIRSTPSFEALGPNIKGFNASRFYMIKRVLAILDIAGPEAIDRHYQTVTDIYGREYKVNGWQDSPAGIRIPFGRPIGRESYHGTVILTEDVRRVMEAHRLHPPAQKEQLGLSTTHITTLRRELEHRVERDRPIFLVENLGNVLSYSNADFACEHGFKPSFFQDTRTQMNYVLACLDGQRRGAEFVTLLASNMTHDDLAEQIDVKASRISHLRRALVTLCYAAQNDLANGVLGKEQIAALKSLTIHYDNPLHEDARMAV